MYSSVNILLGDVGEEGNWQTDFFRNLDILEVIKCHDVEMSKGPRDVVGEHAFPHCPRVVLCLHIVRGILVPDQKLNLGPQQREQGVLTHWTAREFLMLCSQLQRALVTRESCEWTVVLRAGGWYLMGSLETTELMKMLSV